MAWKTLTAGALLIAVGAVVSILSESDSITSWIPAFVGGILVLLGLVAMFAENARHHLMHAAAAVALLMIIATVMRIITAGTSGWVAVSQIAALVICGGYLATAIGSFRNAAAARRLEAANAEG